MRVDNQEFIEWWTPALKEFICSGDEYDDFCEAMEDEFGKFIFSIFLYFHVDRLFM